MATTKTRGRFVWYELYTQDPDAAKRFYKSLIGWGDAPYDAGGTPYTMFMNGEKPAAGMMKLPQELASLGVPPHWLLYIESGNLDDTVAEAQSLGGQVVVPPTEIPQMGRFSILTDPQGASFAAFQGIPEQPDSEFNPELGEGSWHELTTTDHNAAFDFYSKLAGWEKTSEMDMGDGNMYLMYGRSSSSRPLGGMWTKPKGAEMPTAWLVYFRVDDVDKKAEQVKKNGGQVINGPMDVPGGDRIVQCLDPHGVAFALHSVAK